MNNSKFENIARLLMTYNFDINSEALPNNIKCVNCKLVLKDACQVPCGCTFCRVCIDDMISNGDEFCPGVLEECRVSSLTHFATDYKANNIISKLNVKCPFNECLHECSLANMENHIRVCQRKNLKCPFNELGCRQDKLAAEEMNGHFQQANRSHSEIMIGMIVNINKEMETLRHEQVVKNGQMRMILDQLGHLENENKSIRVENKFLKDEIKLIREEKADLANQVWILSEKIEREIIDRRESDERDIGKMIEHVDMEVNGITGLIGLHVLQLDTDSKSVRDDIRSINQETESIKDNIDSIKLQLQVKQALGGLSQIDASYKWTIDKDIDVNRWCWPGLVSKCFTGVLRPYKYQLGVANERADDELSVELRINRGWNDAIMPWPFRGSMVVIVADKNRREACLIKSVECEIEKPTPKQWRRGESLVFPHSELNGAGVDLSEGVRVSCLIFPE